MNRRKVLFVITSLAGGGSERIASLLLSHIDRARFDVQLVLFEDRRDYDVPEDIVVTCLQKRNSLDLPRLVRQLGRVYRQSGSDVVLCFGEYANTIGLFAQKFSRAKVKLLLSQHCLPTVAANGAKNPIIALFGTWIPRWLYPSASRVICVSQRVAEDVRDYYHVPAEKTRVIHNPVDIKAIAKHLEENVDHIWFANHDQPVIISVGRLDLPKGYAYLLRAFARVLTAMSCRLIILGDGREKDLFVALAKQLGIEDRVAFLGFQTNPFKYMARSDCFVLASLEEGSPLVVTEAMACGVPVICTRFNTGIDEILTEGEEGLVVPPANEEALAQAMLRLLSDKGLGSTLARQARSKADHFSIETIVKEYETLFGESLP